MDISHKNTRLISKCTFKDTIDRVYDILVDPNIFIDVMKEFLKDIKLIKGKNFGEIDAEYTFLCENLCQIQMKISEVIINNNFKRIVHKPTNRPRLFNFKVINSLYYDSIEKKTLYVKELVIKDSELLLTKEGIEKYKKEQLLICKRMKEWLIYTTVRIEQEETINIRTRMIDIWNLVTDLKSFVNFIPVFAYHFNVIDDSKVNLINCNSSCYYIIDKKIVNEDLMEVSLISCKDYKPSHQLLFTLYGIDDGHCFLSIKHKLNEGIKYSCVNRLSNYQKRLLIEIKKHFENIRN